MIRDTSSENVSDYQSFPLKEDCTVDFARIDFLKGLTPEQQETLLFFRQKVQDTSVQCRISIKITGAKQILSFGRRAISTKLLQTGAIVNSRETVYEQSIRDVNSSTFVDILELNQFNRDESIFKLLYSQPNMQIKLQFLENNLNSTDDNSYSFEYKFKVDETFKTYTIYPVQLGAALAELGGLIALLKFVSTFLSQHHRATFEKDYYIERKPSTSITDEDEETLVGQGTQSFKEVFTYDNLRQYLTSDIQRNQMQSLHEENYDIKL